MRILIGDMLIYSNIILFVLLAFSLLVVFWKFIAKLCSCYSNQDNPIAKHEIQIILLAKVFLKEIHLFFLSSNCRIKITKCKASLNWQVKICWKSLQMLYGLSIFYLDKAKDQWCIDVLLRQKCRCRCIVIKKLPIPMLNVWKIPISDVSRCHTKFTIHIKKADSKTFFQSISKFLEKK